MDKQSRLIFERYTRRIILEQTPVNSIAPVNVGQPAPSRYDDRYPNTITPTLCAPGIKTTEFSSWSEVPGKVATDVKQAGSDLINLVGKFFSDNPLGIAINLLEPTGLTSLAQVPYLYNIFQKEGGILNGIGLTLGIISVIPYHGTSAEAAKAIFNLRTNLPLIEKFSPQAFRDLIENLRKIFNDTALLLEVEKFLPQTFIPQYRAFVKEMQGFLTDENLTKVLTMNDREIIKGFQVAKGSENLYNIKTFSPKPNLNAVTNVSTETFKKVEPVLNAITAINSMVDIINRMPANLVENLQSQYNNVSKVIPGLYNVLKTIYGSNSTKLSQLKTLEKEFSITSNAIMDLLNNIDSYEVDDFIRILEDTYSKLPKGMSEVVQLDNILTALKSGNFESLDETLKNAYTGLVNILNSRIKNIIDLSEGKVSFNFLEPEAIKNLPPIKAVETIDRTSWLSRVAKEKAKETGKSLYRKYPKTCIFLLLLLVVAPLYYYIIHPLFSSAGSIIEIIKQYTGLGSGY